MAEYITRQDAIYVAKRAWGKGLEPSQYIELLPAADVEDVRHGEWKNVAGKFKRMECSLCGKQITLEPDDEVTGRKAFYAKTKAAMRFCFNCGAKMEEEKNNG